MNRIEAYTIISAALTQYRELGFQELSAKVGIKDTEAIIVPSGSPPRLRYSV